MADSSRRFQPGDSLPDLDRHSQPEPDETEWMPDSAAETVPSDAPSSEDDAEGPASPDTAGSGRQSDQDHVFFDTSQVLSDDALSGETTAMEGRDALPDDAADELDSVLNAAPDVDDALEGLPQVESTGLTDVGFPSFAEPPASKADGDVEAPSQKSAVIDQAAADDNVPAPAIPVPETDEAREGLVGEDRVAATVDPGSRMVADSEPERSGGKPRSPRASTAQSSQRNYTVILLASYASAMTIGFLWLWLSRNMARPHELESLPDVAPLNANEFRYAPKNASMPKGHTIPLGGKQQLGKILVEPLRVTREPIGFTHYDDPAQTKPPTEPTLTLWLRFTNQSDDQLIAPLDPVLLLTRDYQVETDTVLTNQLVLSAADKGAATPAIVIDHPITSEWDLAGQQLGFRLKPGESLETYIPIEPGTDDQLPDELLWRVHFRKGYHDATGHGVTTMIEVPFNRSQVQSAAG